MANDDQRELCRPGDGARAIAQLDELLAREAPKHSRERIAEAFERLRRFRREAR